MAVSIGPKIGLDGEAEYRKALQNIIQQQKTLKAEMDATTTSFDKNATAEDKLKAKSEALGKQIDNQKQRVEKLKEMVEESTKKYGEADTRTLKWREALAGATVELNSLEAEQREVNAELKKGADNFQTLSQKISDAGEKMKDVGGKMKEVGSSLTANITGPIMKLGNMAFDAFNEVDGAMDQLITMTGKTGDELKELEDIAKDLATEIPVSFEEAAQAVGEVNTRFEVTGDQADELSEKFLKFAQINGTDVVSSIDSVQSTLTAWGLTADDAGDDVAYSCLFSDGFCGTLVVSGQHNDLDTHILKLADGLCGIGFDDVRNGNDT